MSISSINLYTAGQLMELKSSTGFHSFITTVWNGTPIMVVWNNLANNMMELWDYGVVDTEDVDSLLVLIRDFLQNE